MTPESPSALKAVAKASPGSGTYVVVVPSVQPGTYDIRLECLPGDWRTNTAEGGYQLLTVLPALPSTSTGDAVTPPARRSPAIPILVVLGVAGGIAGHRRAGARCRTESRVAAPRLV